MGYKEILHAMAPEKYPKTDPLDPYRQKYDFEFNILCIVTLNTKSVTWIVALLRDASLDQKPHAAECQGPCL